MKREYLLPGAIVIAGAIISFGIYLVRTDPTPALGHGSPALVNPVTLADRIIGNPEAPVKIIEYADIDSIYSKQFQATLQQLMSDYAAGGEVAWIYRHFPLLDQHIDAGAHAEAAECAAHLGDEDAFWRFIDTIQAAAPGDNQFPKSGYPAIAEQLGIPLEPFMECLTSSRFTKKVYEDSKNAIASGADGAPYVVITIEGHPPIGINGAISYDKLRTVVDEAIAKSKTK